MQPPLFSSSHILRALKLGQDEDTNVTPAAPVFLAAVLEHVTERVLTVAGAKSTTGFERTKRHGHIPLEGEKITKKKRICQQHLEDSFSVDKDLRRLIRDIECPENNQMRMLKVNGFSKPKNSKCGSPIKKKSGDSNVSILNTEPKQIENTISSPRVGTFINGANGVPVEHLNEENLSGLILCTMGLPGSQRDTFMDTLKIHINKLEKSRVSVHIMNISKDDNLYKAMSELPKEIAFGWHTHILTSCIRDINSCFDSFSSRSGSRNVYITDCSTIECYSYAATDFCNGNLSRAQMEAYRNFFVTATELTPASRLSAKNAKIHPKLVVLYLAKNPVTCRKNIIQMERDAERHGTEFFLQNFHSLNHLESVYSRNLEVISQLCSCKGNILVVSKAMLLDHRLLYQTLLAIKYGKIKLPVITFEALVEAPCQQLKDCFKGRPWLDASNNVFYNSYEIIFASFDDLCNSRWCYASFVHNLEFYKQSASIYIHKQFWIMRSPHIVDVILEHMSRGQNIVIYSNLKELLPV
jgi:hypothetical protein